MDGGGNETTGGFPLALPPPSVRLIEIIGRKEGEGERGGQQQGSTSGELPREEEGRADGRGRRLQRNPPIPKEPDPHPAGKE